LRWKNEKRTIGSTFWEHANPGGLRAACADTDPCSPYAYAFAADGNVSSPNGHSYSQTTYSNPRPTYKHPHPKATYANCHSNTRPDTYCRSHGDSYSRAAYAHANSCACCHGNTRACCHGNTRANRHGHSYSSAIGARNGDKRQISLVHTLCNRG